MIVMLCPKRVLVNKAPLTSSKAFFLCLFVGQLVQLPTIFHSIFLRSMTPFILRLPFSAFTQRITQFLRSPMQYYQILHSASSFMGSLKELEADIQHANVLAASIPRGNGGDYLRMKLVYSKLAPIFLFLFQWMDYSCSCLPSTHFNLFRVVVYKVHTNGKSDTYSSGRKATIREFYSVILPSLQRLHGDLVVEANIAEENDHNIEMISSKMASDLELEREHECGICLESTTKMVLPNCCHAMCINCYNDWNTRSESCPFCRGSLKRVNSGDLWVLTCRRDVIDMQTINREDVLRLYLFVNNLPQYTPDALFLMYYEYLF